MRVVVLSGSLLLASIALVVWWLGDASDGGREGGPAVSLERGVDAVVPTLPRPDAEREDTAPSVARPAPAEADTAQPTALHAPAMPSVASRAYVPCSLRVVVVDAATERPVADATVRVTYWTRGSNTHERTESGVTDAGGTATLDVDRGTLSVVAFRSDLAYARASVEIPAGTPEHELRVVLDETHTLRGVVLDAQRRPLEGATVRSRTAGSDERFTCITDPAGRFGLPWWLLDGATLLQIEREGYGSERLEWAFEDGHWWAVTASERARYDGADDVLEITLRATRRVQGSVVDAQGAPMIGARVELRGEHATGRRTRSFDSRSAFTDVLGRFDVESLRVDVAYHLVARQEGVGVAVHEVPAGGDADVGAVELVPLVPVTGRVVDGRGGAVEHASVTLELEAADGGGAAGRAYGSLVARPSTECFVDAEGRFEVLGAALPGQRLTLRLHDAEVLTRALDLSDGGFDLGDLAVVQGVHAFSGTVLDLDGEPVERIWLQVRDPDGALIARAEADTRGRFAFALPQFDVPPRALTLSPLRLGNTSWPSWTFAPTDFPVTLRIDVRRSEPQIKRVR